MATNRKQVSLSPTPSNVVPLKPAAKKSAAKVFKLPKTLAQCADLLYTTRQDRLALEKQVEAMKAEENQLREHLIQNLPKSQSSGIAGHIANAKIETKEIPRVVDWEALHKYVKRTGAFELLQRRVSDTAIKERWENKKQVPGVEVFKATVVSCTKV